MSSASPPPADAPAPESVEPEDVEFSVASVKAQLKARYVHACDASADEGGTREGAQFAMLAARLLKDITAITQFEAQLAQDVRLEEMARRLEELQLKGQGAGGDDSDPPFNAPETPAPH